MNLEQHAPADPNGGNSNSEEVAAAQKALRNKNFLIRLSAEEKAEVKELAKSLGINEANVWRRAMLAFMQLNGRDVGAKFADDEMGNRTRGSNRRGKESREAKHKMLAAIGV